MAVLSFPYKTVQKGEDCLFYQPKVSLLLADAMRCAKAGAGIGTLRRAKLFVPADTLQVLYQALVQPYFDYCSPLWENCGTLLKDKLQKCQSRAARR